MHSPAAASSSRRLATAPATYRESLGADEVQYEAFRAALMDRGVQLLPGRWYVGMAHGPAELEYTLAAIHAAFQAIA